MDSKVRINWHFTYHMMINNYIQPFTMYLWRDKENTT